MKDNIVMDIETRASLFLVVLAVTLVSTLIVLYRSLKRQNKKREKHAMTLQQLNHLIKRDPTNAMALWQKAEALEAMGMAEMAWDLYQTAHRISPAAYAYHDVDVACTRLRKKIKVVPRTAVFSR